MPQFTQKVDVAWSQLRDDQYATGGVTTAYLVGTAKVVAADRYNAQIWTISAGLSAQQISLAPIGISAPAMLLLLNTDYEVDIRTNAASDTTFLSGVRLWCMTGHVSNLYVTTGSNATTISVQVAGGSNATLTASFPLP